MKKLRDEESKLKEIIRLGNLLTQINDLDLLLERILLEARRFVSADAGSIYKKEGNSLNFKYTQNDTMQKRLPPGKKLIYNSFTMPIDYSTISGYVASTGEILNIRNVYELSPDLPYQFGKEFDEISKYKTQSMLTAPLRTSRGEIIGVLQMINAQDEDGNVEAFDSDDVLMISHFAGNAAIVLEKAEMTRTIILRMIKMAELRDPKETGAHVNRVGAFSAELYEAYARRRGIHEKEIEIKKDILRVAAMLHDVGKVGISDLILKKPAKLTDEEYEIMKHHTYLGANLLSDAKSEFDDMAAQIALTHHERWDGRGYPGYIDLKTGAPLPGYVNERGGAVGMKGEEIPIWGRIVAIADVFDALSHKRAYKDPWPHSEVLDEMEKLAGSQFDPELIEIFLSIIDVIKSVESKYKEEDDES